MFEQTAESGFYVRSDDTFYAFVDTSEIDMSDVVLKATPKGENKVYPFIARSSTPDKDREGEILIQKGLNFSPFKEHGEFNWNHIGFAMTGLPTGKKAWFEEPGWLCQGEIISGLPLVTGYSTDMMVQQHNQLKKSGFNRGLCVSLEGKVTKRSSCGKYVMKANIFNIAHTFRPQNPNCTVSMLTKSIMGQTEMLVRDQFYDALNKNLSVPDVKPMTKEDLEGAGSKKVVSPKKFAQTLVKHLMNKGYTSSEAQKHVINYLSKKSKGK